jgi:hypothetical protein
MCYRACRRTVRNAEYTSGTAVAMAQCRQGRLWVSHAARLQVADARSRIGNPIWRLLAEVLGQRSQVSEFAEQRRTSPNDSVRAMDARGRWCQVESQEPTRAVLARSMSAATDQPCVKRSTEISTAVIVPLFSSQCLVFLSSGQPTPGP